MTGGSLFYSPKKVCQIIKACCMLHNLALRRQVPFLQEDGPDGGLVAAVEPVNSEDEEAEEEDINNRNTVIHQYFQGPLAGWFSICRGWGAGVVVLWRFLLSTGAGRGGGQFIVQASVMGLLVVPQCPSWCLYLELSNVVVFCKCVCILSVAVCTANGIMRLKDRRVDSWVMIAWAYSCWRDGVGFVVASLSLTFGVEDLCGCLDFGRFQAVGRNSCGGIPQPRWCVGGFLHGGKRHLPPML
ncbi:hypothetical protein NDU88_009336 [Pleurodeles waltl]|uniref:Nuclease HARBI1 n=1 Tax=Pleurodeles waltl TaxID=8319 RepID=A0AAV7PYQ7_PLEWA|nr:hypothetical protein NDU88_009336 [Pleurodeles waltl]